MTSFQPPGAVRFRLLLTEVETNSSGIHPSTILFESGVLSIPPNPPGDFSNTTVTVTFPEIVLMPTTTYAFVLDPFKDMNVTDNVFAFASTPGHIGYTDGVFFSYQPPLDSARVPIGPRSDHFQADWSDEIHPAATPVDMAFEIRFVPEVNPFWLVAGMLVVGWCLKARRQVELF